MKTQILKYNISVYGINDMPVAKVVDGYATIAQFHGKTAHKRAKAFQKRLKTIGPDQNFNDLIN